MKPANGILDELRGLNSPLADLSRAMPYYVPEGYFMSFPDQLTIATLGNKQMPFDVPEGYFDALADNVKTKMATDNVLVVPEGYFEQLPYTLLEKVKSSGTTKQKETKIISVDIWRTVRWVAAASLFIALGIGSYTFINNIQTKSTEKELAALPAATINEYIQNNIDEFDTDLIVSTLGDNGVEQIKPNNLTDEEILQFLDATESTTELN